MELGASLESVLETAFEPVSSVFGTPALGWIAQQGLEGAIVQGSLGKVAPGTCFHWGSCAKALAALVVAVLVERGKLSYSSTASELAGDKESVPPQYAEITVEQLLRHSAGVPEDLSEETLARLNLEGASRGDFVALLFEKPLLHPSGSKFGPYSNAGYSLLSFLVEKHLNSSWEELVLTLVAKPLNLSSLDFGVPKSQELVGHLEDGSPTLDNDGVYHHAPLGVHSTLVDWLKFSRVFRGDMDSITRLGLTADSVAYLVRPSQDSAGETVGFELPPGYALGWRTSWVDDAETPSPHDPVLWHLGTNFSWQMCVVIWPKKQNLALCVAANSGSMVVRVGLRIALEQILDSLCNDEQSV